MDIVERIKEQIAKTPVLLFMKGTPDFPMCGFSSKAVNYLKQTGAPFAYVNVLQDPEVRQELPKIANWPTFPQLWVNGELIGGADIVEELFESQELHALVQNVKWED